MTGVEAGQERPASLLPPRATADGTYRRVLEAALERFSTFGYHGVSVRQIAAASGVQASSIYAHVASKEALLAELMLLGHEEHRDRLRLSLLEAGPSAADQVQTLMRAHVRMHAEYAVLARLCNRELRSLSGENQRRVVAIRGEAERLFQDVIERGVRLGEFRVADPWLAVATLGAMGIRVAEWWDAQDRFTVDDVADVYADMAVRLLT